jgi:hypothetical protein
MYLISLVKKVALEEKKSARADAKNSEKMTMQKVLEKIATLEIYNKV